MKKIAREYMKTHLKVQLAGEHINSNMKKPEEVEQLEPKIGMQKKGTLCGKVTFVLPLDKKMSTTPLWPFSPDQKDFTCRHKEVREELIPKKAKQKTKKTHTQKNRNCSW